MSVNSILYLFIQCATLYELSKANPLAGQTVRPAKEGEFPFFAVLSYSSDVTKKNDYYCGGTLISKRHVLTLKHCIDGEDYNITLIVNAANQRARRAHKIKSWITYDDWILERNIISETEYDDIAIITLLDEVQDDVKPAIISKFEQTKVVGNKVMAIGWGVIDGAGHFLSNTFMKAYMNVMNYVEFSKDIGSIQNSRKYPLIFYYTSASTPVVLGCRDCGGPLMLAKSKEVVGIHNSGCGQVPETEGSPKTTRHVSLHYYKYFIGDVIKD